MEHSLHVARASFRTQMQSFRRMPVTTVLTILLPLNLLVLLSLFALTGYRAPAALVMDEDTPTAHAFVSALEAAHHSFDLRPMSIDKAKSQLSTGRLVAIIEIPSGFEDSVRRGDQGFMTMTVDNVNVDLAEDVRRAVRAAAVIFAQREHIKDIKVTPQLRNTLKHDTGYVEYLGVSAIALAAVIAGGVLGGIVTAREWEQGTARLLRLSPAGTPAVLAGRLLAAAVVGFLASALTAGVVVYGYHVPLRHPLEGIVTIAATVGCATMLGGVLGAWLKRTLVITPLILGITLPFYLDSGALEPQRFDGEKLFWFAHLSPTYYAVGAIEHAFHGLVVTPESYLLLIGVLVLTALATVPVLGRFAR